MPYTILNSLWTSAHLMFITTLPVKYYYYALPHMKKQKCRTVKQFAQGYTDHE